MSVACLVSLVIAVSAFCVSLGTLEEITAVMAGSIAAICLVLTLIFASWPLQLALVLVLLGLSRFYISDERKLG